MTIFEFEFGSTTIMGNIMKEIKLEEVTQISSGLVLQRFGLDRKYSKMQKKKTNTNGKMYYHITLKAVDDNKIDLNLLETIKVEKKVNERYLLKKGDIIMKLSPPFSAAVIEFNCKNLIGSSHFAIIRVKDKFDPEYLTYILNGKYVQKQLNRLVEGGILSIIKINYLNEVKIRLRDKSEQLKYAKFFSLLSKRRDLKIRAMELEDVLIENVISNL